MELMFHLIRGKSWEAFSKGLPNVAIHDLVIQNEAKGFGFRNTWKKYLQS